MSLVSVIVPVYNAEKYIEQCIASLQAQTLSDIEIILVNDGSTDKSGEILDAYAKSDDRISVYRNKNQGVSMTRKYGVEVAKSDFICFVDSDDYVEVDYCQTLFDAITQTQADIAECGYNCVSMVKKSEHRVWANSMICDKSEFVNNIVFKTIINGTEAIVLWNKIYRKNIIEQYVKDWGKNLLEDYVFLIQYYTAVNRYTYVDKALINYRQVSGSLSKQINPDILNLLNGVERYKQNIIRQTEFDDKEAVQQESDKWYVCYIYNYIKFSLSAQNKKKTNIAFAKELITDPVLLQKCTGLDKKDKFQMLISTKQFDKAFAFIKKEALRQQLRHKLYRIKNCILPRKY